MDAILFENISHSPSNWCALYYTISSQIIGCCHCHTHTHSLWLHATKPILFVILFYFSRAHSFPRLLYAICLSHTSSSSPVYFSLQAAIPKWSKICFVPGPIFTFAHAAANMKSALALEHWNSAYFWLTLFLLQRCNGIAFRKCHRVCHLLNEKPKCRQH